jgi:nucleoside-diphosphate-sugar epimerase
MKTALIGHSGFVGSNLIARRAYAATFRSTDIDSIRGETFDHVVCCGIQAMKWWANLHPEEDLAGIERLLSAISHCRSTRFTLISTIDVYPTPRGVDENSFIETEGHHSYGLHRLHAEQRVREMFAKVLVLRLPGLFGPGLKKNVIYDMKHDNNLQQIHPDGVFQYYDLRRLADDIDRAWSLGVGTLNLSSGPLRTSAIRDRFFATKELGATGPAPAGYDMRSIHAKEWGGENGYLYDDQQVIDDLDHWLTQEFFHKPSSLTH